MYSMLQRTASVMIELLAITTVLTAVACISAGNILQSILLFTLAAVLATLAKFLVDM